MLYEDFAKIVKLGLLEEIGIVIFIMENLINPEQTQWMNDEGLTIQHLLNGKFNDEQIPTVQAIFANWNMKCRTQLFKL